MLQLLSGLNVLLTLLSAIDGAQVSCKAPPVQLEQDFITCCDGKPSFVSERCIEELVENKTLTEACMVDCLYRDIRIYDGAKIDLKAVEHFFNANVTSPVVRAMFTSAFEYCTKVDRAKLRQLFAFAEVSDKHGCDLYPTYMDLCIWYHTVGNCPETLASTSQHCVEQMQWVQQCLLKGT